MLCQIISLHVVPHFAAAGRELGREGPTLILTCQHKQSVDTDLDATRNDRWLV